MRKHSSRHKVLKKSDCAESFPTLFSLTVADKKKCVPKCLIKCQGILRWWQPLQPSVSAEPVDTAIEAQPAGQCTWLSISLPSHLQHIMNALRFISTTSVIEVTIIPIKIDKTFLCVIICEIMLLSSRIVHVLQTMETESN